MKRFFSLFTLLVIAGLLLSACGGATASLECTDAIGCVEVAAGEDIHLAYMLTISGATAFLGEDSLGGIEIAIADQGELLGHGVSLSGEDSLCSAEGGQTAATAVTADESVVAIIGTNCSGSATAALPTISAAGLVMCSPSNTAPALTDPEGTWQPGYFRAAHNDLFQGRIAAEFAYNELGATTAATVHDGSPYADQLQQVFAATFTELGGTITFQGAVNVGDTDMRSVLTSAAADSPDVLYFPIFEPEGPFIVAQSSEIEGLEDTILFGADGLLADSFPENSGPNAEGMYLSGPYIAGASYDEFLAKWESQIGGVPPSGFHAFAYDCTNMIFDAIEAASQQGSDGTLLIGRQALRDAMATTSGFNGLSGNLSCNEFGDCATGEALGVFQVTGAEINDGAWPPAVVWTP
jgi:branched-chain amino acid transport system substrate-binding protein